MNRKCFFFPFRKTRDDLNCYQEQCDAILSDVNTALAHLDSLQKQYLFVSNKTGTLHEACEQLLKEQVRPLLYRCLEHIAKPSSSCKIGKNPECVMFCCLNSGAAQNLRLSANNSINTQTSHRRSNTVHYLASNSQHK